jgi:hypothetical protein
LLGAFLFVSPQTSGLEFNSPLRLKVNTYTLAQFGIDVFTLARQRHDSHQPKNESCLLRVKLSGVWPSKQTGRTQFIALLALAEEWDVEVKV